MLTLVHCRCGLQVDLLPLAADDALADLGRSLSFFRLRVRVIELLQADVALSAVGAFKAAVQTVVAHATVAIAVTRLLMNYIWDLSRQFVCVSLVVILGIFGPE